MSHGGRGLIFDEDAVLYDRMRPTYPPLLFEELGELAHLSPGSRILEIGPGTGQATVDLAGRGYEVVALEPGPALAAVAKEKLRTFPLVEIHVTSFEAWRPSSRPFDAVVAATSFHWLDPAVRVEKIAHILRSDGALAVISTHHVAGGTTAFFDEVQACYERSDPDTEPGLTLPPEAEVPMEDEEIVASASFGAVEWKRYAREETYTVDEYERLLMTYSGHRALDHHARSRLLGCIRELITRRFAGRITKRYLFQLMVARRLAEPRVQ